RRQPEPRFIHCSDEKLSYFRVQSSFGKVILVHKVIIKSPAYFRIQESFNCFRDKRTKPKPKHPYRYRPFPSLLFFAFRKIIHKLFTNKNIDFFEQRGIIGSVVSTQKVRVLTVIKSF
ncbi:MAG: hypothetical protein J5877_03065, partial [Clostridia bacterium]|nr:hypothetical protein [Clostridia bacterium]